MDQRNVQEVRKAVLRSLKRCAREMQYELVGPVVERQLGVERNRGFIAALCMRSDDRLLRMNGATGLFDENPLSRHFSDIYAMTTQVGVAWDLRCPIGAAKAFGVSAKGAAALLKADDDSPPE